MRTSYSTASDYSTAHGVVRIPGSYSTAQCATAPQLLTCHSTARTAQCAPRGATTRRSAPTDDTALTARRARRNEMEHAPASYGGSCCFHAVALWSCQPEMAPSNGLAQIHVESRRFRLVFGSLEHAAPLFFSVLSSPPPSLYIQWSVLTGRPYLRCPCAPTDLAICARIPSVLYGTGVNL